MLNSRSSGNLTQDQRLVDWMSLFLKTASAVADEWIADDPELEINYLKRLAARAGRRTDALTLPSGYPRRSHLAGAIGRCAGLIARSRIEPSERHRIHHGDRTETVQIGENEWAEVTDWPGDVFRTGFGARERRPEVIGFIGRKDFSVPLKLRARNVVALDGATTVGVSEDVELPEFASMVLETILGTDQWDVDSPLVEKRKAPFREALFDELAIQGKSKGFKLVGRQRLITHPRRRVAAEVLGWVEKRTDRTRYLFAYSSGKSRLWETELRTLKGLFRSISQTMSTDPSFLLGVPDTPLVRVWHSIYWKSLVVAQGNVLVDCIDLRRMEGKPTGQCDSEQA